jgi:murein L,D-transpeptidase YcbB/YkuD
VDEVEHLVFSPFWEVPRTIAMEEIVPKAIEDSTYLKRNRYVLVKGYAESAPVVAADTASIARIGRSVRVRQLPGDYNSLGRVKFMLPNDLNIYLHDTNEKHFFKRSERALSHGCIRVSEPNRLAEWILRGDTAWTPERMKKAMKSDTPEIVPLSEHIPVLIVYHTAAVDERGVLRSYRDVYKLNDELRELLARGFPYQRLPRRSSIDSATGTR